MEEQYRMPLIGDAAPAFTNVNYCLDWFMCLRKDTK